MERRFILKTGLLAILSLLGFTENTFCFQKKKITGISRAGMGQGPFTGIYSNTIADKKVLMPAAFCPSLHQDRFMLVVPARDTSVLLVPENSPEWEILKHTYDATKNFAPQCFWERVKMDEAGRLYLSDKVRKLAGIKTPNVSIIGHGYVIEILDSELYRARSV